MKLWRYLCSMTITEVPVTGFTFPHRVVTLVSSYATTDSAGRAKVSADMARDLSVLIVKRVARHYHPPLPPAP